MGRYLGKLCHKHPELNGARFESSLKCVRCSYDRNNALRKTKTQRERIREYARPKEAKGGLYYEQKKERNRRWYAKNREWRRLYNIERKSFGGFYPEYRDKLREIFANRPDGCHVDHIVPLRGIHPVTKEHIVCGLNVPWNLQYLDGETNIRKWAWFLPV